MLRWPVPTVALVCALTGLVFASSAAASLSPAVADCNAHAQLTRSYSVGQLKTALATMPADIREYTDCYDVIQRALLAQLGQRRGGGGSGQGGGSFLPTPVIVVLIVLGLSAVSFGVLAIRRRRGTSPPLNS
jgi:hypothetical protein